MYQGFSFAPYEDASVETAAFGLDSTIKGNVTMGMAQVKLVQGFGLWNEGTGIKRGDIRNNAGYDLCTAFISAILHVHLNIKNKQIANPENKNTDELIAENSYKNETGKIEVGDVNKTKPLAAIDIAGPKYTQTLGTNTTSADATTNIIPFAQASYNGYAQEGYAQKDKTVGVLGGTLTVEFSMVMYVVAYPTFDGSGAQLTHDPTFSIYITMTNKSAIAVLIIILVVALVGIAAVLITKKKNAAQ